MALCASGTEAKMERVRVARSNTYKRCFGDEYGRGGDGG